MGQGCPVGIIAIEASCGETNLPLKNAQTQTPPYPHPPKSAGWDPQTPEHCFGQAEGSLSNPDTVRMLSGFAPIGLLGSVMPLCYRRVELPFNYISPRANPQSPWRYGTASPVGCRVSDSARLAGRSRSHLGAAWARPHSAIH